jgi:mannose-6-phosphate isomerase-like protein (cupin superfamily)
LWLRRRLLSLRQETRIPDSSIRSKYKQFNACVNKEKYSSAKPREDFFSVDYMDLHILRPAAVIGMHRHRDNQEVFLLLEGKGLMVMGDWEKNEQRERAIELRNMRPGDLSLVKPGQFHALVNVLDENLLLFMFGGYD